jgi:uncharacterized protein (TIGR02231 family)
MKKSFYLLFFVLLSISLLKAEEKPINIKLSSAKVYLNGGELTHNGTIKLQEGYNEIALSGFSFNLDPNSISLKITGSGSVQSVTSNLKEYYDGDKPKEIAKYEDSVKSVQNEINKLSNIILTLDIEMEFINKNNTVNKKDAIVNPSDLSSMADFIYDRTLENKNYRLKVNLEMDALKSKQQEFYKKITEYNNEYQKKYKREQIINASIYSPKPEDVKIEITYYTPSAGWTAFYEARIDEINKPYNLLLKANVWQQCGIDWNDIPVTISSKAPTFNNNLPILSSNMLNFVDDYRTRGSRENYTSMNTALASTSSMKSIEINALDNEDARVDDASGGYNAYKDTKPLTQNAPQYSSFEFTSNNNYTIPSNGKKQLIEIEKFTQEANYEYYSAPKLQQSAYLIAKSANKFGMEMLSGEVNVYFEKSYIGKSYLDFNTISDSIKLSLGIDKGVSVKREIINDFTESKFLSNDIERSFGFKMTFRNNKKQKVMINLEDVVPTSADENIEIKVLEVSNGNLNKTTGKVNWIIELEPGKTIEKILKFSVKHPKNRRISSF